jgi:hypothetical protein
LRFEEKFSPAITAFPSHSPLLATAPKGRRFNHEKTRKYTKIGSREQGAGSLEGKKI